MLQWDKLRNTTSARPPPPSQYFLQHRELRYFIFLHITETSAHVCASRTTQDHKAQLWWRCSMAHAFSSSVAVSTYLNPWNSLIASPIIKCEIVFWQKIKKVHSSQFSTIEELILRTSSSVMAALVSLHHTPRRASASCYCFLPNPAVKTGLMFSATALHLLWLLKRVSRTRKIIAKFISRVQLRLICCDSRAAVMARLVVGNSLGGCTVNPGQEHRDFS